jgi:hypothetical protein
VSALVWLPRTVRDAYIHSEATATNQVRRAIWSPCLGHNVNETELQGFGIPLQARALLDVVYGNTVIQNGQPYTAQRQSRFATLDALDSPRDWQ